MVSVVDISESLYNQYRTITSDLVNDDADFEDPSEIPPEPVTEVNIPFFHILTRNCNFRSVLLRIEYFKSNFPMEK